MQLLIDNTVIYSPAYAIRVGNDTDSLYYYFDYDERNAAVNMEFQHFHPFYEIFILLESNAVHLVDGAFYNIKCCDIVALRPGLLHKSVYPKGAPSKRLVIQFAMPTAPGPLLDEFKKVMSVFDDNCPIYRFEGRVKERILGKINDIFYLSQANSPVLGLQISASMLEFLSLLFQNKDKNTYSNNTELDSLTQKIYDITSYIHGHYTEDITLESIASMFFLSNSYLSHQFKKVTGFTVTDYIQMTRMRNAQSLLISTTMPITDIAFMSGFSSFSQFNRVFHKFQSESPSDFRKHGLTNQMIKTAVSQEDNTKS